MNDGFEDFTPPKYTMESRVATLEVASDTHAATIGDHEGLLRAMRKDVNDVQAAFRVQLDMLNAVRETQSEHTERLREHGNILQEHTDALADLRQDVTGLRQDMTQLRRDVTETRVGIQTIIGLLDRNIEAETTAAGNSDTPG
jgi:hypothetical protein